MQPDGRCNGKGEREIRASDGRWIAFDMAFITVEIRYVRHNIGKVSQNIQNMSDSIKTLDANINNANANWEHSKKIRLKCKRIKCFEGIRCEIVTNKEVFQEKTERR